MSYRFSLYKINTYQDLQTQYQLTREIGHGLELFLPELRDLNGLLLHVLACGGHPLLRYVVHTALQILRIQSCQEIKEILPRGPFIFRVLVREVLLEVDVFFEHGINVADGQLLVVGHLHVRDLALLEEGLLAAEHILQEVLIDHPIVGQVVLDYKRVR